MIFSTTFARINLILLIFLIPIIVLYSYSSQTNLKVVQNTIQMSNMNQLTFFLKQLEGNVDQLSSLSITLNRNPIIQMLPYLSYLDSFQQRQTKIMLEQMLILQSISSSWENRIAVYTTETNESYTSFGPFTLNKKDLSEIHSGEWKYVNHSPESSNENEFVTYNADPYSPTGSVADANVIIKVSFSDRNISRMLSDFKTGNNGDPFLYHPSYGFILNETANRKHIDQVIQSLSPHQVQHPGNHIVSVNDLKYTVNVVQSKLPGWYLIDYLPLEEMLSPITVSRNLFYISIAGLLFVSVIASLLLYRRVQVPITTLIRSVQRLKRGDYSARIRHKSGTEFEYLFEKFNEMAAEIQDLIEKVLKEKIHSRDATLKQLQSQINPHFLYNSLFFINNMVRLGEDEAVTSMTLNLAQYYRYTTRLERHLATVSEEVQLLVNYLSIQKLRMRKLQYEIDIPQSMFDMEIPRLLLQPIVENAIIHGIEDKEEGGFIRIKGIQTETDIRMIIEDNGVGMTQERIDRLNKQIRLPLVEETGYALWNIHQRLLLQFGKEAALHIAHSSAGGLQVMLVWPLHLSDSSQGKYDI